MARGIVKGGLNDGGSNIKSIQRGIVTITSPSITATVTIASVIPANSIVLVSFKGSYGTANTDIASIALIDSTSIKLDIAGPLPSGSIVISWQVIEFNNVKSKQIGTATVTSTASNVTISAIVLSKSISFCSYKSTSTASQASNLKHDLTTTTNLQLICTGGVTATAEWQVIEFN